MPISALFHSVSCRIRHGVGAMTILLLLAVVILPSPTAQAKDRSFEPGRDLAADGDFEFDQEKQAWKEDEVELPAYPEEDDLVQVPEFGATGPLTQYLDTKTLTIGKDEVVRYTVVLESRTGVRNVSFEGIRCFTNEYKVYGYGTRDKQVRPLKKPRWKSLFLKRNHGFRKLLATNLMCDGFGRTFKRERIIELLESGNGVEDNYEPLYGL